MSGGRFFFCGVLQLFSRVAEEKARQSELYLVGVVCYYGRHYSTFFFQTRIRRWIYFDDAHVKEVTAELQIHNRSTTDPLLSLFCSTSQELE